MQLGMIGLGRMGANMVRRLLKAGHKCAVFDMSHKAVEELIQEKAVGAASVAELAEKLTKPRAVWLMVPAAVVDKPLLTSYPFWSRATSSSTGGIHITWTISGARKNSRRRKFTMWTWERAVVSGVSSAATA